MKEVHWDRIVDDYVRHRKGYPDVFYASLRDEGLLTPGMRALDVGSGTLDVARGLAKRGLRVAALDPTRALLAAGREVARRAGLDVATIRGTAEHLPFADDAFDLCVVSSAWAWCDPSAAGGELRRVCRAGGHVVLAHFVWCPDEGTVGGATAGALTAAATGWNQKGRAAFGPAWAEDLRRAGFVDVEKTEFDVTIPYSLEGWRGRVRASVPVGARMTPAEVAAFDRHHGERLAAFDEPLAVPHRILYVAGLAPAARE